MDELPAKKERIGGIPREAKSPLRGQVTPNGKLNLRKNQGQGTTSVTPSNKNAALLEDSSRGQNNNPQTRHVQSVLRSSGGGGGSRGVNGEEKSRENYLTEKRRKGSMSVLEKSPLMKYDTIEVHQSNSHLLE